VVEAAQILMDVLDFFAGIRVEVSSQFPRVVSSAPAQATQREGEQAEILAACWDDAFRVSRRNLLAVYFS